MSAYSAPSTLTGSGSISKHSQELRKRTDKLPACCRSHAISGLVGDRRTKQLSGVAALRALWPAGRDSPCTTARRQGRCGQDEFRADPRGPVSPHPRHLPRAPDLSSISLPRSTRPHSCPYTSTLPAASTHPPQPRLSCEI